jgi:hypothetical protein
VPRLFPPCLGGLTRLKQPWHTTARLYGFFIGFRWYGLTG